MNSQTIRTLTILAAILLVVGLMIPAPMARLAMAGLGGLLSLISLRWGKKGIRLTGALILLTAVWIAADAYSEASAEYQHYSGQSAAQK